MLSSRSNEKSIDQILEQAKERKNDEHRKSLASDIYSRAQTTKATDKQFSFAGDKAFNSEVFQL